MSAMDLPGVNEIDLSGFRPADLSEQPQPMLIWAPIDQLVIDRRYQRGLTARGRLSIQKIADEFDWRKFQPILVAPADGGRLAVVDGKHRAHAAALVGLKAVPAMTVAMTLSEQAAGFAAVNRDRVKISLPQIYRAELAAGTGWAIECHHAVDAAACTLLTYTPSSQSRRPGDVTAHSLLRKMVESGESAAITTGLKAIRASCQGDDVEAFETKILKVWLPAIARNQLFERLPLSRIFDDLNLGEMIDQARHYCLRHGGSAREVVIAQIVESLRRARASAAA